MSHPLSVKTVYVEGDDDVRVLRAWYPNIQFTSAGGKDNVERRVEKHSGCYGLRDRDFADDTTVAASRAPDRRLVILSRYCIENYLLEPDIVVAALRDMPAVADRATEWTDEATVQQRLLAWGQDLALYAAANSIVSEWREVIQGDFLRYFGPLPPISREEVVRQLRNRLGALMRPDEVDEALDARYRQVVSDVAGWDGFHRWLSGKVLLESCLSPELARAAHLSESRLRDALIEAGKNGIPAELQELAQRWTVPGA